MAKELYLFGKETTQRIATAVKQVESHPPTKPRGRGANGHPNQLIGKITAAGGGGAGYYDVTQVAWNGAAWAVVAGGLVWDGGVNLPEVYEINATAGIAVDTIVFPYLVGATDGSFQWVFAAGGSDAYTVMVSANDTTPNYLEDKLVAGTYIDLTTNNDGGDETITIDVDLTEVSGYNGANDQVLVNESGTIKWIDLATFVCPP